MKRNVQRGYSLNFYVKESPITSFYCKIAINDKKKVFFAFKIVIKDSLVLRYTKNQKWIMFSHIYPTWNSKHFPLKFKGRVLLFSWKKMILMAFGNGCIEKGGGGWASNHLSWIPLKPLKLNKIVPRVYKPKLKT